ncbi:MAG: ABC transporter ATP-binding protein [Planctomycetota bacterium]
MAQKTDSFWRYAGELRRDRWMVIGAIALSIIASTGLGVGLATVAPILGTMLPGTETVINAETGLEETRAVEPTGLQTLAWSVNERLLAWPFEPQVPEGLIEILPERPWRSVVVLMCVIGFLTVLSALATFGHQYLALTAVYRASQRLRDNAFEHVIRFPLRVVLAKDSSDIARRVVDETERLAEGFAAILSKGVMQCGKGLAALIVAIAFDPRVTIVSLVTAPVLWFVIRSLGRRVRRARRRAFAGQAALLARAGNVLRGLRVVKVQTAEPAELAAFRLTNKKVVREMLKARTARALSSPISEVVAIFVVGVLAAVAVKAVLDNELDPRNFILALMSLGIAAASLRPLTGIINEVQSASAASDRLAELMSWELEAGRNDGPLAVSSADEDAPSPPRLPELPRHSRSLAFDRLSFTYPGADRPALEAVDLEIAHGERVAFVGPNGSGKTTLLSFVPRLFVPDAGRVLVDGLDIAEHSVESLRSQIGAVTQETVIFPGTIRSNIAYGTAAAVDEQIEDAVRRAHATDFIGRLPDGLDTAVGEQGLTLSGGQRQRIAIARAILRDPAILIMDEATSMIDADSEAQIGEAISEFSRGRTTLVVAHRLSTVVTADRIAVLEAGRLVDQGTHPELLDRCDVYRTLARTQLVGSG